MRFILLPLLIVLFGFSLTFQRPDLLRIENETYSINSYPLVELQESDSLIDKLLGEHSAKELSTEKDSLTIITVSSGCWREFYCTWDIKNDKPFLKSITNCVNEKPVPLNVIFLPTRVKENKVFANWFSGEINGTFKSDNFPNSNNTRIKIKVVKGEIKELNKTFANTK